MPAARMENDLAENLRPFDAPAPVFLFLQHKGRIGPVRGSGVFQAVSQTWPEEISFAIKKATRCRAARLSRIPGSA